MRYIIMCGGDYPTWEVPRQLTEIKGEPIVARTIRLLRKNGIKITFLQFIKYGAVIGVASVSAALCGLYFVI